MTHFSANSYMVRGEVFRTNGKWYMTIAINMNGQYRDFPVGTAIINAMKEDEYQKKLIGSEYILVVLDPYHEHAHPQMIKLSEVEEVDYDDVPESIQRRET